MTLRMPLVDVSIALDTSPGTLITTMAVSSRHIVFGSSKGLVDLIDRQTGSEISCLQFGTSSQSLSFFSDDESLILRTAIDPGGSPEYHLIEIIHSRMTKCSLDPTSFLLPTDTSSNVTVIPKTRSTFAILSPSSGLYLSETVPGLDPHITRVHAGTSIVCVAWSEDLLAWATTDTVYVIDVLNSQKVASFNFQVTKGLKWLTGSMLMVHSETDVAILSVEEEEFRLSHNSGRSSEISRFENHGNSKFKVTRATPPLKSFSIESEILTVSLFQDGYPDIAILTFDQTSNILTLSVMATDTMKLRSSENLEISSSNTPSVLGGGSQRLIQSIGDLKSVSIVSAGGGMPIYIVSPNRVVSVYRRDFRKHAEFFISEGKYEAAILCAKFAGDLEISRSIAFKIIRPLVEQRRFEEARVVVPMLRLTDALQWATLFSLFDKYDAPGEISSLIPYPPSTNYLRKEFYDRVLEKVAAKQPSFLIALLTAWPKDCYSVDLFRDSLGGMVEKIRSDLQDNVYAMTSHSVHGLASVDELKKPQSLLHPDKVITARENLEILSAAHRYMFEVSGDFEEALGVCLRARNFSEVSNILTMRLAESPAVRQWAIVNALGIFSLNLEQGVELFVSNTSLLPPSEVKTALGSNHHFLYKYDMGLFESEISPELSDERVEFLFARVAEFEPQRGFNFIQKLETQGIFFTEDLLDKLLGICESSESLLESKALILWKSHRPFDAMKILTVQLGAVDKAVDFARRINDPVLWDCLLSNVIASGDPTRIDDLLKGIKFLAHESTESLTSKNSFEYVISQIIQQSRNLEISSHLTGCIEAIESTQTIEDGIFMLSDYDSALAKKRLLFQHSGGVSVTLAADDSAVVEPLAEPRADSFAFNQPSTQSDFTSESSDQPKAAEPGKRTRKFKAAFTKNFGKLFSKGIVGASNMILGPQDRPVSEEDLAQSASTKITGNFCCFCLQQITSEYTVPKLESAEEFSIGQVYPNSAGAEPWLAVFQDGRTAHVGCLTDFSLRAA